MAGGKGNGGGARKSSSMKLNKFPSLTRALTFCSRVSENITTYCTSKLGLGGIPSSMSRSASRDQTVGQRSAAGKPATPQNGAQRGAKIPVCDARISTSGYAESHAEDDRMLTEYSVGFQIDLRTYTYGMQYSGNTYGRQQTGIENEANIVVPGFKVPVA